MAITYGWCFVITLILSCFFVGFLDDRCRPTTKRRTHNAELEDTQPKADMMDKFVYGPYKSPVEITEMWAKIADYDKMKSTLGSIKRHLKRKSEQLRFDELDCEIIEQRYSRLTAEWTDMPPFNSIHTWDDRVFEKELVVLVNKLEQRLIRVGEIISDMDSCEVQLFTQKFMKMLDTMNRSISYLEFEVTHCKKLGVLIDNYEARLVELRITTQETSVPIQMPIGEDKIDN